VISLDSYYKDQSHLSVAERARVNFDHPSSLDGEMLADHLRALRQGNEAVVPVYDFATHSRSDDITLVHASEFVVVEGILLFALAEVFDLLDYRVFRHCPEEVRFRRRAKRDVRTRGRSPESVQAQLHATVKPMHDEFVEPAKHQADRVVEHGESLGQVAREIADTMLAYGAWPEYSPARARV